MEPSERVAALYSDMYAQGKELAWRDAGAVDKASNIVRIFEQEGLPPHPRVVELGCGEGALAAALVGRGFAGTYIGFDISQSGIDQALARAVPQASFRVGSGERVPLDDDVADVVILSHVVEHLEHPRALLYEARRIARHLIVEVPLELNARLPRDYVWDELGHINKYTSTSIRHLVQTCDLEVIAQFTTNPSQAHALFGNTSRKRRLEWQVKQRTLSLAPGLARMLFTYHETLLARRPT
jgi:ubiquinone/menaquinone biosynthesis C-methylase UbiE